MLPRDFEDAIERDHLAINELVRGNPEPKKAMFSHADDVTLANPFGPPALGWKQVAETIERAASLLRDGEPIEFERISAYASGDLGYTLDIERNRMKLAGSNELSAVSLRATTVYRREDGVWKNIHRQADPITSPRSPESVIDRTAQAVRA